MSEYVLSLRHILKSKKWGCKIDYSLFFSPYFSRPPFIIILWNLFHYSCLDQWRQLKVWPEHFWESKIDSFVFFFWSLLCVTYRVESSTEPVFQKIVIENFMYKTFFLSKDFVTCFIFEKFIVSPLTEKIRTWAKVTFLMWSFWPLKKLILFY